MKLNLVLKNSFWPIIAKFINLVFIVILIKFLSLNVDSYTFGEIMFLMSQLTIFTTITKFGLTNYTQKIFLDNKIKSNEIFSFLFFFKFSIIFLCVSLFIFLNRGHFPISIIMAFVLISSINDLFVDHKYFTRDFKKTFIAQFFINLLLLLMLFFSSKQVIFDEQIFAYFYSSSFLIFFIFYFGHYLKNNIFSIFIFNNIHLFKKIIIGAIPYLIIGIVNALIIRTDIFLLDFYLTKESVGYYVACTRVLELSYLIPILFLASFKTIVLKMSLIRYRNFLIKFTKIFFKGSLFLCFIVILFSENILAILYNDNVANHFRLLQILILSLIPNSLLILYNSYYMRNNLQSVLLIFSFLTLLLNFLFNILLIPNFGAIGAAFSSVFSFLLAIFVIPRFSRKTKFIHECIARLFYD